MQRVIEGGESPEVVVRALGFHRSVMYQWLAKFRNGGMAALEEKPVPGRPTKLRPAQLQRLYQLVVGKNPLQLRFAYGLRASEIAARVHKSPGAVRMVLARALNTLRELYAGR